jgi:hypothetical protein
MDAESAWAMDRHWDAPPPEPHYNLGMLILFVGSSVHQAESRLAEAIAKAPEGDIKNRLAAWGEQLKILAQDLDTIQSLESPFK